MMHLTIKAIDFATEKHKGQTRKVSGLPYIVHPMNVFCIAKNFKESHNIDKISAACVLHDTVEDCNVTYEDLFREFGCMVAGLVMEVTTDSSECSRLGKTEYMKMKMMKMSSYALIIKLSDNLANLSDNPNEKTIRRIREVHNHLRLHHPRLTSTHCELLRQIDGLLTNLYHV